MDFLRPMSALENQNQQWYIEEIPAILDSYDESADEQRPAPVDGDLQNAGEPLIALGVGSMSLGAKALNVRCTSRTIHTWVIFFVSTER